MVKPPVPPQHGRSVGVVRFVHQARADVRAVRMLLAMPAVSVVMAVRDGEPFVGDAVQSILGQSFADLELIAIDDGSSDRTPEVLDGLAAREPRMVVRHQPNEGVARARNGAVALARAPLVAFIDADDLAEPERLRRQVQFLEENEDVAVLGGAVTFVGERGQPIATVGYPLDDEAIRVELDRSTPFVQSAVMLRKQAFEAVGGYRSAFRYAQDLDLWLRLAERVRMANLPDVVARYRFHRAQASMRQLRLQALSAVAARVSARARAAGAPDPFDHVEEIDDDVVLRHGGTTDEITAGYVRAATWLAKMATRAGFVDEARELLGFADAAADGAGGDARLGADVHRAWQDHYEVRGQRLRAKLAQRRAVRAERG